MTQEATTENTIESVAGYYEAEEIAFGVVYKWCSGSLLMGCGCGKVLALTRSLTTCGGCDADHALVVREELGALCSEDENLHPWRYAGDREGLGLSY